jgi:hypothetical protein
MLANMISQRWILWSGTLNIIHLIPIDLRLKWGFYNVGIQSSTILDQVSLSMTIPDIILFMQEKFKLQTLKPTTIPLYYTIVSVYTVLFLFELYCLYNTFQYRTQKITRNYLVQHHIIWKNTFRICCGLFILSSLFSSYNTKALCLNDYIPTYNATIFQPISVNINTETCSYGWNLLFTLWIEVMHIFEAIYIWHIYYDKSYCEDKKTRSRKQSNITNEDLKHVFSINSIASV